MAGEWIPIDCNLATKPEVLEVAAATHEPIEVVVGRMVRLWSWAWHVTADGTIRVPRSMLATVAGGDETFWSAVERAGWLASTDDSITIPGWEERFGNAAKRRLLDARAKSVRRMSASCPHDKRTDCGLEERRGEEKREEDIPAAPVATSDPPKRRKRSQPKYAICWSADSGWQGITDADRETWETAYPACTLDIELVRATEWLKANPAKAHKSNWRRFLVSWLTRSQDRGGTIRLAGKTADDAVRKERLERKAKEFADYQPAPYRRPKEVMALAESLKLTEEDQA